MSANPNSNRPDTILRQAAARGDHETVESLLNAGTQISTSFLTSTLSSALHSRTTDLQAHIRVIELMLAQGVHPDPTVHGRYQGPTALCLAVQLNSIPLVKLLIGAGASLELCRCDYDSRTTLHVASLIGNVDMLQTLLDAGVDLNGLNDFRNTPLTEAIHAGHIAIVKMLLDAGADPNVGLPSLDIARKNGNKEIVELIQQAGGMSNLEIALKALDPSSGVTSLFFHCGGISPEDGAAFITLLRANTSLTSLTLRKDSDDIDLSDVGISAADLFCSHPSLVSLTLSSLNLADPEVGEALSVNSTLLELKLENCQCEASICQALKTNSTLMTLIVFEGPCEMEEEDSPFKTMGDALKVNSCLTTLQLSELYLDTMTVKCIADGLRNNSTLTKLTLTGNHLYDEEVDLAPELIKMLQSNTTLKMLDIDEVPCSEDIECLDETTHMINRNLSLFDHLMPILNTIDSLPSSSSAKRFSHPTPDQHPAKRI